MEKNDYYWDNSTEEMPKWWEDLFYIRLKDPPGALLRDRRWCYPLFDHIFFTENNEVILEPYNVEMKQIEVLINFCKENGLEVIFSGKTIHHPDCFRVIIRKLTESEKI